MFLLIFSFKSFIKPKQTLENKNSTFSSLPCDSICKKEAALKPYAEKINGELSVIEGSCIGLGSQTRKPIGLDFSATLLP